MLGEYSYEVTRVLFEQLYLGFFESGEYCEL